MSRYPFLRFVFGQLGGMTEEELVELEKKVEADPKSYIEVLKNLEDKEDEKIEKRPLD